MRKRRLELILYSVLAIVMLLSLVFNVFDTGWNRSMADAGVHFDKTMPAKGDSGTRYAEAGSRTGESDDFYGQRKKPAEMAEKEKNGESAEPENKAGTLSKPQNESAEDTRNINPEGFHLYVDLDRTLMYVYRDGELLKTYEVSGGKASTPSPTGVWKIVNKDTWGEGFGGAWLGFNVPWGMYGIHGTKELWFVGRTNVSKGCIRMKNADVKELYNLVPYNTAVTIVNETRPFHSMKDGDIGSDVLEVEKALKTLGYYQGSEDGIYGTSLQTAVKEFQKNHRLYRTGVVNISTYELMMKLIRELE